MSEPNDNIPDSVRKLLGMDDDTGDDTGTVIVKPEPAPKPGEKKHKSRDGKSFDTLEELEAYVHTRDENADVKFRTAAALQKAALDAGGAKPNHEKLKPIDLSKIDIDTDPEKFREAVEHNTRVTEQKIAEIESRVNSNERTADEIKAQKELKKIVLDAAEKRGIKLRKDSIEAFLDNAPKFASNEEFAEAFTELLATAQNSAAKTDDDDDTTKSKEPNEPKEPKEPKEPIRVPGGGMGGLTKKEVQRRAVERLEKLQKTGEFDTMSLIDRVNLSRLATGDPQVPEKDFLK